MNPNRTAIAISLALHGGAICLVFALNSSFAHPSKPIEIDFTVIEPSGLHASTAPAVGPQIESGGGGGGRSGRASITHRLSSSQISGSVGRMQKKRSAPVTPALEPLGPVTIPAKPSQLSPAPPVKGLQPGSEAGVNGSGTSGSSRGAGSGSGSGSGGGSGAEELGNRYRAEHFAYIKKIIEENISYPDRAKRLGWSGKCVVNFVVQESGHTKDIKIMKSTGYELLDDNIMETIRKVEPFPRPPVSVKLTIPFTYNIY